jgi:GNAT superfamily N-acetyltransferase
VRVWLAQREDAPHVSALLIGFRDHMGRDVPSDASIRASVERLLDEADCEFLLAAGADGAAAGVCQLRYRYAVWHESEDCWLEDLYIAKGARGAGLGRALVGATLERARARSCGRVGLDCSDANAAALALYASFDFTTGKQPGTHDLYLQAILDS